MDKYEKYWNDLENEKGKAYWIEEESDLKLMKFIQEQTNLERCFIDSLNFANKNSKEIHGNVIDIGAGVAWGSAILSKINAVQSITAVDLSEHRLVKIAPLVFKQMDGKIEKFNPKIIDFFKYPLPTNHYNVAVFCQALCMFPDINNTLKRVSELLVPGGLLIVTCERITPEFPPYSFKGIKRRVSHLIRGRADISGNHFYTDSEYKTAIERNGFEYMFQPLDYPLYLTNPSLNAGNHFGINTKKE